MPYHMIINYTKLNRALSIFLITTVLFTAGCSKKGSPNPDNGTQTDNTPTITSISPGTGEYNTEVIIYGTNFSSTITDDKVYFNSKAATVTAATSTQLTVKVPQDAGTGAVTISVKGGTTVTGPVFGYAESVKITSTDISSGTPGTVVKITGAGFSTTIAYDQVYFNGKAATVTAATATQLTVAVPAGASTGPITVSVNAKPAATGPVFTYIETLKIISTDVNRGIADATVKITGTGFSTVLTDNKIFFNGTAATVVAATATQITVKVPQNCGIGKITISLGNQSFEGPNFDYYYGNTTVTTLAGVANSPGTLDGTAAAASFGTLAGITADQAHNVYVCDNSNGRIRKITPEGVVTTVLGNLVSPQSITIDASRNIYFSDASTTIKEITAAGVLMNFAGDAGSKYVANPPFSAISGLAVEDYGSVYVADYHNGLVRRVSSNGVSTMAGSTVGTVINGIGTAARFGELVSISYDQNYHVYIGDSNGFIRVINSLGEVTTVLEQKSIRGLTAPAGDGVFFTWDGGRQIRYINGAGKVAIVAGTSDDSPIIKDGDQYTARFSNTNNITNDIGGHLYIADNNCIRKITFN